MDTSLAILRYERPALAWPSGATEHQQHILWWVVYLGFAYAAALLYATYCTHSGGHSEIDFGWTGFKVSCRS
jgi:hypothetical protein